MSTIKVFTNPEEFWEAGVTCVRETSYHAHEKFRIAASGGSAAQIFDALKNNNFDFSNVELFQVDERFVPQNHPDSNYKLLYEKIGNKVQSFHCFPILDTPEESADKYKKLLQPDEDGFLFDLIILGIGPDGHTASLFPRSSDLTKQEALTAHTTTDAFSIPDRMTLTFPALERSKFILVLMQGKSKRKIFEKITDPKTDFHDYPARKLLDFKNPVQIFFLEADIK